jgi:broad specificity phosphatase PhoE
MTRPEKHIAVVSHSGFLYAFLMNFLQSSGQQRRQESMGLHFRNCEMRSILLSDGSASLNPEKGIVDTLYFSGGVACLDQPKGS